MTAFLVIVGLLAAGALAFVVPSLLRRGPGAGVSRDAVNVAVYRDQLRELEADLRAGTLAQDQYEIARREIEARLLQDVSGGGAAAAKPRSRAAAIAFGIAIPVCALAVYLAVGNPEAVLAPGDADSPQHSVSEQQVQVLVERLAARLKDNPEDAEGWVMLGRSHMVLGRFKEAVEAYANATARMPKNAQLLADYADALGMAQGRSLEGEPERIIARALAVDPGNVKALALAGTAAFDKQDYAKATDYWGRIVPLVPQDSELAQSIRASIAEAQERGGGAPAAKKAPVAAGASRVSGVVKLAPELAAKVRPEDTVFIFARPAEGPRMPLAILRRQARDLPLAFTLDDTMAMSPAMKLSDQARIVVGARISKTASANPQAGDLQGLTAPVKVGAERVSVVIDTELR